ncbi:MULTISPECIES: hypothetical protein [Chlorobium/Pelodictyon group]|jgi:hypothetical protein|uniref:Uncharacterized protein n=2 Tax=Chlorobium/Pelodictyon group TaxID=274493 RepID=A1BCY0_CHLPD|nr:MULTISPECIES: hypothetical protein [Chlorobium/Pelodictyon group]ABL64257.1 hypothetical protein Cpha266_0190 [Chlorobium phaeobacteroides DSM 266]ACF44895.1 conserved hypothetical protein [Pelodictyon phaeoclathratiforme BU-1]MBV5327995.1 hypothetical protein [Chlorobium sp.]
MPQLPQNIIPEELTKPAAAIVSGAFLLSPLGIPPFIRGIPRVLLAGAGGFLAGAVAEKVIENIGQILPPQPEDD